MNIVDATDRGAERTAQTRREDVKALSKDHFSDFVLQAAWTGEELLLTCTGPSGEAFSSIPKDITRRAIGMTLELRRKVDS